MDDYIRREAAKAQIRMAYSHIEDRVAINCVLNDVPAADVTPVRHGYWEDTNKSVRCHEAYRFNWWCSECGEPQHTPVAKTLGEFTKENPFCHCCGAKMDGGVNDA